MSLPVANVLQPLIDVAEAILKFWHDDVGLSWGLSIIGLTVVVRAAILPLTFKQVRSMQDLQRLQPEMKKLQERYKDDRQRMNQEVMKLYQEHKVNPLGSCLPILLQLPFFISLFYLLRGDEFQRDIKGEESFLFIDNLAEPATGGVLVILIVLYVVTQLISGLVSTVTADPMQRRIMLALPFIFVVFIISFESGLIVYWITTNTWTIGQQLLVRKLFPKPEPIEVKPDGPKPARGKPPAARAAAPEGKGGGNGKGSDGAARKAPPPGSRKKKKRTGRRR
jgi:YidC/Oxa1 family membrane protein insertase